MTEQVIFPRSWCGCHHRITFAHVSLTPPLAFVDHHRQLVDADLCVIGFNAHICGLDLVVEEPSLNFMSAVAEGVRACKANLSTNCEHIVRSPLWKRTQVVTPWEHVWKKDGGKSNLKVKDMVFTTEFAMAPMPDTWCEGCSFQCDVPV